jgi:hypothetical protein
MSGRSPRWISVKTGTKVGTLPVGSTLKLNLNGTPWEWLVGHQGLPSEIYDASCNGTWLLLKYIYGTRQWNSTHSNVLETSEIQSYLNGEFLGLFDPEVQSAIKQVKIPYRKNGGSGGTDQNGKNGLPCKVFMLSGYEVGWTTRNSSYLPVDGAKLDYFVASTVGNSKRIAYLDGSANEWFLRSPYKEPSYSVWLVQKDGAVNYSFATRNYGIRPAIILPPDFRISGDLITAA